MKNQLDYKTDQFGINDNGIHLHRSDYIYKSIEFKDIQSSSIKKELEYKSWIIMLLFGIGLLAFAFNHSINLINYIRSPDGVIYIESFLIPFFPMVTGIALTIMSFRKTLVLKIITRHKKYHFSLRPIIKKHQLDDFLISINSKIRNIKVIEE